MMPEQDGNIARAREVLADIIADEWGDCYPDRLREEWLERADNCSASLRAMLAFYEEGRCAHVSLTLRGSRP